MHRGVPQVEMEGRVLDCRWWGWGFVDASLPGFNSDFDSAFDYEWEFEFE